MKEEGLHFRKGVLPFGVFIVEVDCGVGVARRFDLSFLVDDRLGKIIFVVDG